MKRLHSAKFPYVLIVSVLISGIIVGCTAASQESIQTSSSSPVSPLLSPTSRRSGTPLEPRETLTPLTLESECGGARGVLKAFPSSWEERELYIYFAPLTPTDARENEGFFVLEPSVHPRAEVYPGTSFQLGDISPQSYVVLVGPNAEEALPVRQDSRPRIFEVEGGQILDLGEIEIDG